MSNTENCLPFTNIDLLVATDPKPVHAYCRAAIAYIRARGKVSRGGGEKCVEQLKRAERRMREAVPALEAAKLQALETCKREGGFWYKKQNGLLPERIIKFDFDDDTDW